MMMTYAAIFARFPPLETKRLRLRQLRVGDADALMRIFGDDAVTAYYDLPTMTRRVEVLEIVNRAAQRFRHRESIRWAITRPEEDVVLGTVGLSFESSYRASVGYELASAYWRQGIMSEALTAVLAFAFEQAGLHRVQALVMPGNQASSALLHKLGFTDEGILREYLHFKGAYQDLRCFSLLRHEFAP